MIDLVAGEFTAGFAPVVERFGTHLRSTPYGGAALAVYVDGNPVIDVWGGLADPVVGQAWEVGTAVPMFSCSKSVATVVVLHLVQQGLLRLDQPVACYWPEFGAYGKQRVTLREVMGHRAGVPLVDRDLTREQVLDGITLANTLADQEPLWEPGSAHAYHAVTLGALLGEIVLRVTGRTLGTVLAEDIATPLGLDLWIGLPDLHQHTAAAILPQDPTTISAEMRTLVQDLLVEDDRALRALTVNGALPVPLPGGSLENAYNSPQVLAAELPAANGVGTARSLARLHAALIGPVTGGGPATSTALLDADLLRASTEVVSKGPQALGPQNPPYPVWGSGFMLPWEFRPMLGPRSFGHDGAAGGLCFADPDSKVGFAFLPSVMGPMPDLRVNPIVEELRRCLSARGRLD